MKTKSDNSFTKTVTLILCFSMIIAYAMTNETTRMEMALSAQTKDSWNRMTYMMFHANILHLMLNIYAMLVLVFLSSARMWQLAASIAIASMLPDALIADTPMLGISVASYALTGILIANSNRFWFLLIINASLVGFQMALPNIAVAAHAFGFAIGVAVGLFYKITLTPRYE